MKLPDSAARVIERELERYAQPGAFELPPLTRKNIYAALGPSYAANESERYAKTRSGLPDLTKGDRVRTRVALLAARKVEPLWAQACRETEENFAHRGPSRDPAVVREEEDRYVEMRAHVGIERISALDVPRAFVPSHILELAELTLSRRIEDYEALNDQSAEWWGIYGRPEMMEREFFIKWAAEESLYEANGLPLHEITDQFSPGENASLAYAGVYSGDDPMERAVGYDTVKEREFWHWWLTQAIPTACEQEE